MIIYNKKDSVYFSVTEGISYVGKTFSIYKTDEFNCVEDTATYQQTLDSTLKVEAILEDGRYLVEVRGEGQAPDLTFNFIVFYNYLPNLITKLRHGFCECKDCSQPSEDKLYETYFEIVTYLNCIGLYNELPLLTSLNCRHNKELKNKLTQEQYYGSFNFSHKDKIKEYFSYLYAELYMKQIDSIKEEDSDIGEVNTLFEIDTIKRCFYNSGSDLDKIIKELNLLNCNCDGL